MESPHFPIEEYSRPSFLEAVEDCFGNMKRPCRRPGGAHPVDRAVQNDDEEHFLFGTISSAADWSILSQTHEQDVDLVGGLDLAESPEAMVYDMDPFEPSVREILFDAEWEAFEQSMRSNEDDDDIEVEESGSPFETEDYSWLRCLFCQQGHDPCVACFMEPMELDEQDAVILDLKHSYLLVRQPGWPRCPFCTEGHDPCTACFD